MAASLAVTSEVMMLETLGTDGKLMLLLLPLVLGALGFEALLIDGICRKDGNFTELAGFELVGV